MLVDRVILRIERAGGDISEAVGLAERQPGISPDLIDRMVKVNVALGDLRSAAVKLSNGEDLESVMARFDAQFADLASKRGRQ